MIITRNINKDNTIRFKSNRYSVPLGTYTSQQENQVWLELQGEHQEILIIRRHPQGDILAEHRISMEKGKLIKNRNHMRDRSKGIEELKRKVISSFRQEKAACQFIEDICLKYPRYRRDQLSLLQTVIENDPEWIEAGLQKCIDEKLYSANDFRDVVSYLKQDNDEPVIPVKDLNHVLILEDRIQVATRSLNTYTSILGGNV